MLNDLLKEIQELQEYKHKYKCALKDKQNMSNLLFELMTEKYNNTSFEERKKYYIKSMCDACRFSDYCNVELPKNIGEPIKSDKAWIPATKTCGDFEWR